MTISIKPKRVFYFLTTIVGILLILNFIDIYLRVYKNYNSDILLLTYFFNFQNERSFPTMYSSIALIFAAMLLYIISLDKRISKVNSYMWFGLSFIFVFLSADELLSFHEKISSMVQEILNTSGIFYYAWVIPYALFLLIFLIIYSKFLFRLNKKIRMLFIVSGLIFVIGAIGLELFESQIASETNNNFEHNLVYYLLVSSEEFLEMMGIVLFIYSLFYYINQEIKSINLI